MQQLLEVSTLGKWSALNPETRAIQSSLNSMFTEQGKLIARTLSALPENATSIQIQHALNDAFSRAESLKSVLTADSRLQSLYPRAMNLGANRALRESGVNLRFDISRSDLSSAYLQSREGIMNSLNITSRARVQEITQIAIRENLTPAQLAARVRAQYREWSLSRARSISMTELSTAYETAADIVAKELAAGGRYLNIEVQRKWQTRNDDRVSEGCAENQSVGWIPVGESFPSGDEHPPRHVRCRCATETRTVRRESRAGI